jgi:tetratricopeptide (TPR) repeat protein
MLNQQRSYRRIPIAEKKGLTALVVELCEDHFRRFPDDQFALIWYAMAKIQLHQYSHAEKALLRSIALCKTDKKKVRSVGVRSASVEMGRLLREKGDLKKASFWYRRALRADPKYGDAYIFLGDIASKRGLLNQAESFYRKAINCSAQSIDEAHFNLGGVLLARRRYQEAIKCYRKAIEIDPNYVIAKKRLKDALLVLQLKKS